MSPQSRDKYEKSSHKMQNENKKQTLEGEKEKEIETEFFIQMTNANTDPT